jgi:nucleoside-diphosphate-sugar epimerase
MKRVLVTGATGCIGHHAVNALVARGWEVHAVSSREAPTGAGVVWHRANLLRDDEMEVAVAQARASHLLHLAWYVAPGRWAQAPENFAWVKASIELVRQFDRRGGVRIVTAGSCLEYDWRYGYCAEDRTPCNPHTVYGACKRALQILTEAFSAASRVTQIWARLFFLYGPYEHPDRLVPAVIRALISGEPALCSHGNQIRDYLFAADAADALVTLLESDVTGTINVASGQAIRLREIVDRIGALLGRPELIRLGAIPPAPTDAPLVVADVTRLQQSIRWSPKFDLDTGLSSTIDWWRRRMAEPESRSTFVRENPLSDPQATLRTQPR